MAPLQTAAGGFALAAADRVRLVSHVEQALRRARRDGEALAAVTVRIDRAVDPTAVVAAAARATGQPWFCLEQPDRDRFTVAGVGCVRALEADGADRFTLVGHAWRALAAGASCDPPDGPRGSGPVAVGGFAFGESAPRSTHWAAFPAASLHVPSVALARSGDDVRLTAGVLVTPDDTAEDALARVDAALGALDPDARLPLWDPDPAGRVRVAGAMAPEHYVGAVARGVERIRAGALEKIVLAREVLVEAARPHDAGAVVGVLREAFPSCHVVAVGRGSATFIAATPELLVRREGMRAGTLALAGTTHRSADPAVDDHLGEQLLRSAKDREEHEIVARRIERALRPHSVWVTRAQEPEIVRIANVQHLATPIRAQLAAPLSAIELGGVLHPTPAVGGEPWEVAARLIPELEGLDRGWYAGPLGWTDVNEDGELCVALRCALLEGRVARCHAGVGVVRESDPAAELAETEVKLQAMLPALGA